LVSGLIDLFNEITDYNGTKELLWEHLTNYLIENVIESDLDSNAIPSKYISKNSGSHKMLLNSPMASNLAPIVIGGSDLCLRRIAPSMKQNDSNHHMQGIRKIEYSAAMKRVIVLDNITDSLLFYDEKSQIQKTISPNKQNHILDTAILYFAYSNIEKRVGCCLQDYTLAFWDLSDDFKFEKTFSTDLDYLQVFIKYIDYCGQWITYDLKNVIFVWDIEMESF
jgi:hypothetical protein